MNSLWDLIDQWKARKTVARNDCIRYGHDGQYYDGKADGFEVCAEELESYLSAIQPRTTPPTVAEFEAHLARHGFEFRPGGRRFCLMHVKYDFVGSGRSRWQIVQVTIADVDPLPDGSWGPSIECCIPGISFHIDLSAKTCPPWCWCDADGLPVPGTEVKS